MDTEEQGKMDEAADKARVELEQNFNGWTARQLAKWWDKWFLKAGHKRLGRILLAMARGTDRRSYVERRK